MMNVFHAVVCQGWFSSISTVFLRTEPEALFELLTTQFHALPMSKRGLEARFVT